MNRAQSIAAARQLIKILEALPEDVEFYCLNSALFHVKDLDTMMDYRRRIGGKWDKTFDYSWAELVQHTDSGMTVGIYVHRDNVCERVITGKEIVEMPDPDAPKVKVERDVVEWVCPPSLMEAGE